MKKIVLKCGFKFLNVNKYRVYILNENNIYLKSIQVIDLLGRPVYETSAKTTTMFSVPVTTGIYMVRLISDDDKVVTSKVHLTK